MQEVFPLVGDVAVDLCHLLLLFIVIMAANGLMLQLALCLRQPVCGPAEKVRHPTGLPVTGDIQAVGFVIQPYR